MEKNKKYYTGIGSRSVPKDVFDTMVKIAKYMRSIGYTLRSGKADGSDWAFQLGSVGNADIFLPWKSFGADKPDKHARHIVPDFTERHKELARLVHPVFDKLKPAVQNLHMRNINQICGEDLEQTTLPLSEFVVCWTPDGAETPDETSSETGGTGTAIRLAGLLEVPVFNLKNACARSRLKKFIKEGVYERRGRQDN